MGVRRSGQRQQALLLRSTRLAPLMQRDRDLHSSLGHHSHIFTAAAIDGNSFGNAEPNCRTGLCVGLCCSVGS